MRKKFHKTRQLLRKKIEPENYHTEFFFSQMTFGRNGIPALTDGNLTFMNLYFKMNLNMSSNEQC